MKQLGIIMGGLLAIGLCNGCASIICKSSGPVTYTSNPSGATVTIKNKNGVEIQRATTPTTVCLPYDNGYFSKARYTLQFEKDGYETLVTQDDAYINGWYWGNIGFGGLIGLLIVDPATGSMWTMADDKAVTLQQSKSSEAPKTAPTTPAAPITATLPAVKTDVATQPATSNGKQQDDIPTQLKKLKELKDANILTNEEYETRRTALVAQLGK